MLTEAMREGPARRRADCVRLLLAALPCCVTALAQVSREGRSVPRDAHDFGLRGDAFAHQAFAILAHELHAGGHGGLANLCLAGAAMDLGANGIVHRQQLEDAGAAPVASHAAIEAARAGEHGRGFAVVADEIRKLAETSNKFTEIISELVKEMRLKVKDNIENSSLAEEKLKEINEKVLDTNVKIEKVSKAMEEQADSTKEVAEAIHSLSEASTDIEMQAEDQKEIIAKGKNALDRIADVIEHQTASTEEVAAASEELAGLAETLDEIVRKFDISAGKKV